jgi:hypothetical protein
VQSRTTGNGLQIDLCNFLSRVAECKGCEKVEMIVLAHTVVITFFLYGTNRSESAGCMLLAFVFKKQKNRRAAGIE